jgi:Flp pilus assembly protein TadG
VRRVRRKQTGQIFALAAISMTAIIAIAAFVIDVGSWYQVSRQAQAAADAGATAAANDLPGNPAQASTDATTYVNKNISGATTTTVTPYNGDSSKVKVTVSINAPTFFAKIFGINSVPVTASSAAKRVNGGGKWAIFADSTACGSGGFNDSGSNITVAGGTRTNSSFTMSGSNNTFGVSTYGGPNNCSLSKSGSSDTFNGAANPTADATNCPWPEPWPQSAAEIATYGIGCTFSGTNFNYSTSNATMPSGTYCYTGSISISGSSNTCTCTVHRLVGLDQWLERALLAVLPGSPDRRLRRELQPFGKQPDVHGHGLRSQEQYGDVGIEQRPLRHVPRGLDRLDQRQRLAADRHRALHGLRRLAARRVGSRLPLRTAPRLPSGRVSRPPGLY